MKPTRHPGIYKRGSRYVVRYRAGGRNRAESARTLEEALRIKRARESERDRGEFQARSRVRFREYAELWVERYQGTGRRGFRESTRDDYRRHLREFAYPFFDDHLERRLAEVSPSDIAEFIGWLCDGNAQGRSFSDSTVRNILNPIRSCFATAVREGLVRHNPTIGAALPHRDDVADDGEEEVRVLTREQLAAFLAALPAAHRTMFQVLAATGLRVSELIALQWRHVRFDGPEPCVRVRRQLYRGRVQPPKSRHGRRDIPLSATLVAALRKRRMASAWPGDEELVFPSMRGTPLKVENLRRRVLRPAARAAGVDWIGFHTFRHTCAALLFDGGLNVKQVQRWLGHHSPSFTLDTYVHLLDERLPAPLDVESEPTPEAGSRTSEPRENHNGQGS